METKLTLKLKKRTIEKGKAFARKKKTSLSKLVENFIESVTEESSQQEISPLVKSLSGVITNSISGDYARFLKNKYK